MSAVLGALALATGRASSARESYRNPTPGAAIVLQIPGMHRAKVTRNVVYARLAGRALRLDVYRPAASRAGSRLPGVLLVHGITGDPSPKDWGIYVGWGQQLAAHGLVGIPFNHTGKRAEVRAALAAVRAQAGRLGVAGDRLCVASFSAGVELGMAVALADERVRCALGFYGAPDAGLVRADMAPVFLAKAGLDSDDINAAIDRFVAQAQTLGARVRLVVHPNGVHGFDLRTPGARTRAILREAVRFAKTELTR